MLLVKGDALRDVPFFRETEQARLAGHIEVAHLLDVVRITAVAVDGAGVEIEDQRTVGAQDFYVHVFQRLIGKTVRDIAIDRHAVAGVLGVGGQGEKEDG